MTSNPRERAPLLSRLKAHADLLRNPSFGVSETRNLGERLAEDLRELRALTDLITTWAIRRADMPELPAKATAACEADLLRLLGMESPEGRSCTPAELARVSFAALDDRRLCHRCGEDEAAHIPGVLCRPQLRQRPETVTLTLCVDVPRGTAHDALRDLFIAVMALPEPLPASLGPAVEKAAAYLRRPIEVSRGTSPRFIETVGEGGIKRTESAAPLSQPARLELLHIARQMDAGLTLGPGEAARIAEALRKVAASEPEGVLLEADPAVAHRDLPRAFDRWMREFINDPWAFEQTRSLALKALGERIAGEAPTYGVEATATLLAYVAACAAEDEPEFSMAIERDVPRGTEGCPSVCKCGGWKRRPYQHAPLCPASPGVNGEGLGHA